MQQRRTVVLLDVAFNGVAERTDLTKLRVGVMVAVGVGVRPGGRVGGWGEDEGEGRRSTDLPNVLLVLLNLLPPARGLVLLGRVYILRPAALSVQHSVGYVVEALGVHLREAAER